MNCKEIGEFLPDLAAGLGTPAPEVEKHVAHCTTCSARLEEFRKTMALLDQWEAPEPSPYFDTRVQARLREEMARPVVPWYRRLTPPWFLRPAWGVPLAAVLFAVAFGVGGRSYLSQTDTIATKPPALGLPVEPGTALGDLQALERNDELFADFDVLDDLEVQDDVTANP